MNKLNEKKKQDQQKFKIIVGMVGSADLDALQKLQDFFKALDGFSLIYLTTSGSHLYITDKKPEVNIGGKSND